MSKMIEDLLSYVREEIPIITVNKRLSRYISEQYNNEMMAKCSAWKTPVILHLFSWIEVLWRESWPSEALLSHSRSNCLWNKLVANDKLIADKSILMAQGAANIAFEAYSLMKEYDLSFPKESIYLTEEALALKSWIKKYEKELKKLGFVDNLSLKDRVIKLIKDGKISLPEKIVLAGFDEISPRSTSLLKELESKGVNIVFWPYKPIHEVSIDKLKANGSLNVRMYSDEVEEVIQAARWVRQTFQPGMRIGIIVPELNRYRSMIKREFSAELDPESVLPGENDTDVFNISLGKPLYEEPVVKSAIDILSIDESKQEIDVISSILQSPFILLENEYFNLGKIDAQLKSDNVLAVSLSEVRLKTKRIPSLSDFNKRLDKWINFLKNEGSIKKLPSQWAGAFSNFLNTLNWPSRGFTLKSSEYQAFESWNSLLESFANLDDILGNLSRAEAVSHLYISANDTIHQPETPECPIQIMGMLEASGLEFDHVWIMGVHEDAFPYQPSPNPFVPLLPHERDKIPHFTPERELSFAKIILRRLLSSSSNIEVSYPARVDEKENKLSRLFRFLAQEKENPLLTSSARYKDTIHSQFALENLPLEKNIPVTQSEINTLKGGTTILASQSACPFKAFAIHRLHASDIEKPEPGFNALERGSIVHDALKFFWENVKDSKKLNELVKTNKVDMIIKKSVEDTLKKYYEVKYHSSKYIDLESERLTMLLRQWIDVELERGNFVVREKEVKRKLILEGLPVRTRIDRIDETGQGEKILIDYKTGKCSKNDWLTERPKEPQMLLYNLADNFDAIAYASVKFGEFRFVGTSEDENVLPKVKSFNNDKWKDNMDGINNLSELKDKWKKTLTGLSKGFIKGEAQVDPNKNWKGNMDPCTYCELTPLCRIYEAD